MVHVLIIGEVLRLVSEYSSHMTERNKNALEAGVRELTLKAQMEKDRSQAAIMMKIVEGAQNLANKRLDFLITSFHETYKLIGNHHAALLAEQKELLMRRFQGTLAEQTRDSARRGEIEDLLITLEQSSSLVAEKANRMAQQIGSPMRLPAISLLSWT